MSILKLESIRLTHVRVPLNEPFAISNGVVTEKDAILVEIRADGLVGIGEASPMAGSFYSRHTPDSSWSALTGEIVPRMNAARLLDLTGAWLGATIDDPFAACGIDTALWDLAGRLRDRPLWAMIGGNPTRAIESGLAVGIYTNVQELLDRIDHYLAADGYRRVKIKVQPGWDVEPLDAVRRRFGDMPLMVDANCAYRREHIDHLASWDRFGLMMIEQPLPQDDLEGHALLAGRSRTPICLDESAESVDAVREALDLRAAGIINIKLQRLGTMAAAIRVHDLTAARGVGCWMGTMPELAVAGHAAIQFATMPNIRYPTDVEASNRWFVADVTEPAIHCHNGLMSLPIGPGLGVKMNGEVVHRYIVKDWSMPLNCELACNWPLTST